VLCPNCCFTLTVSIRISEATLKVIELDAKPNFNVGHENEVNDVYCSFNRGSIVISMSTGYDLSQPEYASGFGCLTYAEDATSLVETVVRDYLLLLDINHQPSCEAFEN
jgi:hypothetical protein